MGIKIGIELETTVSDLKGKFPMNSRSLNREFVEGFINGEKDIRKSTPWYALRHDIEAGYRQIEVKNDGKKEAVEAARDMLKGIVLLSEYMRKKDMLLPFNEMCLNEYDISKNCTAEHIIGLEEIGSKRAKMLIPFLINLFKNMSSEAKNIFGLDAQNDIEYLEFIRNSTTLNSGLHVNLDLSEITLNDKPLIQKVRETHNGYRYVATDFNYMMLLEKYLYMITPLFITHTSVSPYIPINALPKRIREEIIKKNEGFVAIDTGGNSSRIMLMYSLNPRFGPSKQYEVYGHAAYLRYWLMVKNGNVDNDKLIVELESNASPFNSYGSMLGLSKYLLEMFGLYGIPESLGQNPEIAMHWLPIAHPYAYPKSIGNGNGVRPALEYKIMGGSVEGILASIVLAEMFSVGLKVNLTETNLTYPQYDQKTNTLSLPSYNSIMKLIKHSIYTRRSPQIEEYNKRVVEIMKNLLDDKGVYLLEHMIKRIPSERILNYTNYAQMLNQSEAEKIIIKSAADSINIVKEDLKILDAL